MVSLINDFYDLNYNNIQLMILIKYIHNTFNSYRLAMLFIFFPRSFIYLPFFKELSMKWV